jgi:tetratricopeptide (TPR) repeat protein
MNNLMMMKITATIFLLSLPILCPAQIWKKNKIVIDSLIVQKKTSQAQLKLLKLEKSIAGYSAEEQFEYRLYVADFYNKNKFSFYTELEQLEKAAQIATVLYENDLKKRYALDWKIVSKVRRNGNYKFSTNWYNQNIKALKSKYGEKSIEMTEIYSVFAAQMSENADYNGAFLLVEKMLPTVVDLEKTNPSTNLAQVVHRIGFVYYNFKNLDKAFAFYQQSIEIFKKVSGENSESVAEAYSMLGETYNGVENGDLGLENTLKALAIVEKMGYGDSDLYYFNNSVGVSYTLKK